MITLRKAEDRRHLKRGRLDTWMTFDPESRIDPLRRGFHALEALNEQDLGPGTGLPSRLQDTIEIVTYVRDGTLILQGDDDQIVPYADAALLQAKLVKGAALKVYKGAPHGMCTTLKDQINDELLTFIKARVEAMATA